MCKETWINGKKIDVSNNVFLTNNVASDYAQPVVKQKVPDSLRFEPKGGLKKQNSWFHIWTHGVYLWIVLGFILLVALVIYLILCGEGTGCTGGILGSSGFCPYSDMREWLGATEAH